MKGNLRIIFMGTPAFAVASLAALCKNGSNVVAVITVPDKPAGRGLKFQQSPVKEFAMQQQIPVLQPEKLKNPDFLEELRSYNADLQIVVAFRMLPEVVWNMPKLGTFNLHASLLPNYRGAAPINHAIINGEEKTGLTTFFLQHEIDTGDLLLQQEVKIGENETAGELHDRLMQIGADLVVETVKIIESGNIEQQPQPTGNFKAAPKIFKEDTKINWHRKLHEVHNFIRGMSPFPGAFTYLDGKVFKIYKTEKEETEVAEPYGTIITDHRKTLKVSLEGGYLHFVEIQAEGKRKMTAEDFLRGYKGKFELT